MATPWSSVKVAPQFPRQLTGLGVLFGRSTWGPVSLCGDSDVDSTGVLTTDSADRDDPFAAHLEGYRECAVRTVFIARDDRHFAGPMSIGRSSVARDLPAVLRFSTRRRIIHARRPHGPLPRA